MTTIINHQADYQIETASYDPPRPLDVALKAIDTATSDELVAAKCKALMRGYHVRWDNHEYTPLQIERVIETDLWNVSTGRKSRSFSLAGKVDLVAERHGRRFLIDHKTTSQDIQDPDATYWRQLSIEGQVDHYLLMLHLLGEVVDNAIWDVVRKPTISPRKLTKKDRAAVASLGEYYGRKVSDHAKRYVVDSERESLELYEIRLTYDCTVERPDWYFQRKSMFRLNDEIAEYARELWQHSQDINRQRNTEGEPPRNSGACLNYGTPCKFLGICSGHDTPTSDKWTTKPQVHNELDLEHDGKNALTNSRIKCWQTCRRKHYYEYELGIKRHEEEDQEALHFGTVFHAGQEAYWETIKQAHERSNNGDCDK